MTDELEIAYSQNYESTLVPISERLLNLLTTYLADEPRIDRITTRAKSVSSFLGKARKMQDGVAMYDQPLNQVQDQIGARVITFYKSDVERIAEILRKYFRPIEDKNIVPESDQEFGYFGRHFVFFCPSEILKDSDAAAGAPKFFELQIKTLYQHAWSEANHDLGYKEAAPLSSEERRKIAFTAAQSWGADTIFEELYEESRNKSIRVGG